MGGVFDPVHNGHLAAAEAARERFGLERVFFVPAGQPPHRRTAPVASSEDRYLMTAMAVNGNPHFVVSRLEMERSGPSYAIDTVLYFRHLYRDQDIYFITGLDAAMDLPCWHQSAELLNLCRFVVVTRPGYRPADLEKMTGLVPGRELELINAPGIDTSSTIVRKMLAAGRSVRYLIPDAVADYIAKKGLYLASRADAPAYLP